MKDKYFSINKGRHSIRCKLFCNDAASASDAILCCHGFGGSKESKSVERLARRVLAKRNDVVLLAFDWPCHGEDAKSKLSLEDCDRYLAFAVEYAKEELAAQTLYAYATSFGAYLTLKYVSEHENPFSRIALRSAAVRMYEVLHDNALTAKERSLLVKGKEVMVGFHRKIRIGNPFMDSLREADISVRDYVPINDKLLMIHGTKDELVSIAPVQTFAEKNSIPFLPVENADHMFTSPEKMDAAVNAVMRFFWTAQA